MMDALPKLWSNEGNGKGRHILGVIGGTELLGLSEG